MSPDVGHVWATRGGVIGLVNRGDDDRYERRLPAALLVLSATLTVALRDRLRAGAGLDAGSTLYAYAVYADARSPTSIA